MKSLAPVFTTLLLVIAMAFGPGPVLAQTTNNANLTQSALYGNWMANALNAVASGASTMSLNDCYFRTTGLGSNQNNPNALAGMNSQFFPLGTNAPVTIVDGANTETVTPSAVQAPTVAAPSSITPWACSFTATFSNAHGAGVPIISADSGLAEAANDNGHGYGITAGAIEFGGGCTGTATSSATLIVQGLGIPATGAAHACTATTITAAISAPRPGVLKNLNIVAGTAGVGTGSGVFTVYKNGSATAITCTVGESTGCSDVTHTVTLAIGDTFYVAFTTAGSETLAAVTAQVELF